MAIELSDQGPIRWPLEWKKNMYNLNLKEHKTTWLPKQKKKELTRLILLFFQQQWKPMSTRQMLFTQENCSKSKTNNIIFPANFHIWFHMNDFRNVVGMSLNFPKLIFSLIKKANSTIQFMINYVYLGTYPYQVLLKSQGLFTREATKRGRRQFTYLFFIGPSHLFRIALEKVFTREATSSER